MISAIIDDNLDRIRSDLTHRGLNYNPLMEDMLDHVCCMVEDEMGQGRDFASSYVTVMSSIDEKALPRIQHQTLLNLDKKYQRMKNFTYIFGLSSALVTITGSIFKKMHWPGAGILISLGIMLVVLVFLPMYFITMQKEQEEKKNPVYGIVGYFTIALLLAGALFKIMHWPGAGVMLHLGLGFLVVGFVPLYVVNVFQRSGSAKITLPYVAMLLVGVAIVMLSINVNLSKDIVDIFQAGSLSNEEQVVKTRQQSAMLLATVPDSVDGMKIEKALQVHRQSLELAEMIRSMQDEMKVYLKQPGASLEEIKGKDNKNAAGETMLDNGAAMDFITASRSFLELLRSYLDDPVAMNQVEDHLEFTGEVRALTYGPDQIRSFPFIETYYILTDANRGIALAEYVALSKLLN